MADACWNRPQGNVGVALSNNNDVVVVDLTQDDDEDSDDASPPAPRPPSSSPSQQQRRPPPNNVKGEENAAPLSNDRARGETRTSSFSLPPLPSTNEDDRDLPQEILVDKTDDPVSEDDKDDVSIASWRPSRSNKRNSSPRKRPLPYAAAATHNETLSTSTRSRPRNSNEQHSPRERLFDSGRKEASASSCSHQPRKSKHRDLPRERLFYPVREEASVASCSRSRKSNEQDSPQDMLLDPDHKEASAAFLQKRESNERKSPQGSSVDSTHEEAPVASAPSADADTSTTSSSSSNSSACDEESDESTSTTSVSDFSVELEQICSNFVERKTSCSGFVERKEDTRVSIATEGEELEFWKKSSNLRRFSSLLDRLVRKPNLRFEFGFHSEDLTAIRRLLTLTDVVGEYFVSSVGDNNNINSNNGDSESTEFDTFTYKLCWNILNKVSFVAAKARLQEYMVRQCPAHASLCKVETNFDFLLGYSFATCLLQTLVRNIRDDAEQAYHLKCQQRQQQKQEPSHDGFDFSDDVEGTEKRASMSRKRTRSLRRNNRREKDTLRSLLCRAPEEPRCVGCGKLGYVTQMITCCGCLSWFHNDCCIDSSNTSSVEWESNWQCAMCISSLDLVVACQENNLGAMCNLLTAKVNISTVRFCVLRVHDSPTVMHIRFLSFVSNIHRTFC